VKTLRPDQEDAIARLRQKLNTGIRRVVMMGATGYGKGLVAASIIRSAREKGKKVLLTVPAISLVDQMVDVLYEQGITDVGVIQASHHMTDWSKPVQVASVQTLQRKDRLPECDLILIDECHILFKFYEKLLLSHEQRCIPKIGFSATPFTKGLGKYYQDLIIAATTEQLIAEGKLSPFRVFAPSHPDLKGVRTLAGDYHEGDLADRMNQAKLTADIISTWQAQGENRPTICFAVNRAHAAAIADQFKARDIGAGYMDCETSLDERRNIRRQFLAGELRVICNVDVVGMGIDWPEVSCVIYARPTKSEIRYVQNIGRALRTAEGKVDTIILDHSDTTLRLGFVTNIRHDQLDDGEPKERAPAKIALPKECPQCHYLKPPRMAVCPACGFVSKIINRIEPRSGELRELTGGTKSAKKFPDRIAIFGQLMWWGRHRGYKDGWAANKYRDLYGVWPRGCSGAPHEPPGLELASWIRSTEIRWAKSKRLEARA
jgi:superfamily II DNA or RNA helicase